MTTIGRWMEIFDGDEGRADYAIVMQGVGLSGRGVDCELARDGTGQWIVTERDNGLEWTVRHEHKSAAVLLLIARRLGFEGELRYITEGDE